jgi:hypothetical protein
MNPHPNIGISKSNTFRVIFGANGFLIMEKSQNFFSALAITF